MLVRCTKCGKVGLIGNKTCPHCSADISDEFNRAKNLGIRVIGFVVVPVLIAIVSLSYMLRSEGSAYDDNFAIPELPKKAEHVSKSEVDRIFQQVSDPNGSDERLDELNRKLGGPGQFPAGH